MKKVLIALQVALVGLFLYNTGIFGVFNKLSSLTKDEPFNVENNQKFHSFIKERVFQAEQIGTNYSPKCYFSDIEEIKKRKKELPGSYEEIFSSRGLQNLMEKNISLKYYSREDLRKAAEEYDSLTERGDASQEKLLKTCSKKDFWPSVGKKFVSLLSWLAMFYLKNLPLALICLLIWWYKQYKTLAIRNPFSFAITVLIYPYVIGKVWRQMIREALSSFCLEVDLRKTKEKFFTLLSKDEIKEIRHFAKSNFGRKIFLQRLRSRGLETKRSFASALAATLLLSFISVLVADLQAETMPKKSANHDCSTVIVHESPPASPTFESGGKNLVNHFFESLEAIPIAAPNLFITDGQRIDWETFFLFPSPLQEIEHIPLVG